jgi:type IV secretion system protein VirB7
MLATLTGGCTHAGPFVTNISAAGNGKALIEKCMVEFNMFLGTMSESDCSSATILLTPQRYRQQTNGRRR